MGFKEGLFRFFFLVAILLRYDFISLHNFLNSTPMTSFPDSLALEVLGRSSGRVRRFPLASWVSTAIGEVASVWVVGGGTEAVACWVAGGNSTEWSCGESAGVPARPNSLPRGQ